MASMLWHRGRMSGYLVKPSVALDQIERKAADDGAAVIDVLSGISSGDGSSGAGVGVSGSDAGADGDAGGNASGGRTDAQMQLPLMFTMSAKLDDMRVNHDVRTIMEVILSQLMQLEGANVELSFGYARRWMWTFPCPPCGKYRRIAMRCIFGITGFTGGDLNA